MPLSKDKIRTFIYNHGYKGSIFQKIWVLATRPKAAMEYRKKASMVNSLGDGLLRKIGEISGSCHVCIWPEFGTLLGGYRDKSFISFDPDIDLGILRDDLSDGFFRQLEQSGMKRKRSFHLVDVRTGKRRLVELTLNYNGLDFDLFISDRVGESLRRVYVSYEKIDELDNRFKVKYYTVGYSSRTEDVDINGQILPYPGDAAQYLKSVYGNDFMTPIKGWRPPQSNPIMTFMDPADHYCEETIVEPK